jgi:uncharacterized protein YunC (DUF1805 family)
MKKLVLLLALLNSFTLFANETAFDWSGLEKEIISLGAPLLIIKGSSGFIGCGYIDVNACIDEVCATVSEVNTHDEMLTATITNVSKDAAKLGISIGMSGAEAVELLK